MTFHFFTKGDRTVPSSRYRAYYIAEALERLGHRTTVTPATDATLAGFFRYAKTLLRMSREDVLYLQRPIYNKYFSGALLLARALGRRFILDFDDAVYEHSPFKTALLARVADSVICGSEAIRSWSIMRNPRSFVLTNSVPLSVYTVRENEPEGVPVIGWIGTLPKIWLQPVLPALIQLAATGRSFRFRVIGAMGDQLIREMCKDLPDVDIIDSLDWANPCEAVEEIKKFSIGIMPLTDSAWDQVKYFKALEYMACGVPVVASDGATIRSVLTKADCGFIARDTSEWVEMLIKLLDDPSMRAREGEAGRRAIERCYSTDAIAETLVHLADPTGSHSRREDRMKRA